MKRIYRCDIDTNWTSYEALKNRHVVAQGWSGSGDVSFFTEEEDRTPFVELMLYEHHNVWTDSLAKVKTVFDRLASAQPGDIFVATEGQKICGICELPPRFTYAFMPDDEYANCLYPVVWVDWHDFCKGVKTLCRSPGPMRRISSPPKLIEHIETNWEIFKKDKGVDIQPLECDERLSQLIAELPQKIESSKIRYATNLRKKGIEMMNDMYVDFLVTHKNVVLTGAPGTGKTYLARQIASKMILGRIPEEDQPLSSEEKKKIDEQIEFVQFHPSYDYTDFVEGLRPVKTDDDKTIGFERRDGIFKEFCWRAAQKSDNNFDSVYERFIADISEAYSEEKPLELKTEGQGASFYVYPNARHNLNLVTGPSMQKQGSLTPDKIKSFMTDTPYKWWAGYYRGVLNYLKKHYGLSSEERKEVKPYVFIIDEINRGDISKIFGELFYAVDKGYRGVRGRVKTQYQNLIEEGEPFYEGFYVPENVYIIGTMNDIDRNVESMDFAIRRRFTWKEIEPSDRLDAMWADTESELLKHKDEASQKMRNLNATIETMDGLGKAYQIGPSYFKELGSYLEDDNPFGRLWEHHLEPLLREYLRGVPDVKTAIEKLKAAYGLNKADGEPSQSDIETTSSEDGK